MTTSTTMEPPAGLKRVQALLAAGGRPPIGEKLDFGLVEVGIGLAVFEGTPDSSVYNPLGTVHGGYAATLLDSACGIATASMLDAGQSFTTLELKVAYHKAMTEHTGTVRATGTILNKGRRVVYAEAKLTDAAGVLIASATSTLLVLEA